MSLRSGAGCPGAASPGDEGPRDRGKGAGGPKSKKVRELEVKEKDIRKSNSIVILGGKVHIWMDGTSGAEVLVHHSFHFPYEL